MAIKYPIRKRVHKGPKIVNRGSGYTTPRNPKASGGKPPVARPPKRVTHKPHPTAKHDATGMTTPGRVKHALRGVGRLK